MQRDVIKWLQSMDLTNAVQNPKRDLATGHAAAAIVCHYSGTRYVDLQRLPSGVSAATKRDIWLQVHNALQKLNCQSVTPQLIDAVLRREPNAALTVLECLYEHFTGHTLPMRGLDAVGTTHNAYVQPMNAASTARLLAVADGDDRPRRKGASSKLHDPLERNPSSQQRSTTITVAAAKKNGVLAGVTHKSSEEDAANAGLTSPDHSTRAVQQRLALIDNDELAGGANALVACPRYARPTASTLVHTASGARKDVVLDRPKYTADEVQQRAQNARITQQHAVVRRLQRDGPVTEKASSPEQQGGSGLVSSWTALYDADRKANIGDGTSDLPPLTAVYRGRFYRAPDGTTVTNTAAGKAEKHAAELSAGGEPSFTCGVDGGQVNGAAGHNSTATLHKNAAETVRPRSTSPEKSSRTGSAGNSRAVPKLCVKVHSPALKTALALRSGAGQLRERAADLSRELFAKHNYMLRPALSEILADVLSTHKQLEHLLDCSSEDGSGEVLENVLGHLLAHRQAFPLSCMRACWDTLNQHVDGIVAVLQRTPDEYSYLLESFAFAFTWETAQVPVLHLSSPGGGTGSAVATVVSGYSDVEAGERHEEGEVCDGKAVDDAPPLGGALGRDDVNIHNNNNSSSSSSRASAKQFAPALVDTSVDHADAADTRRSSAAAGDTLAAKEEQQVSHLSAAEPPQVPLDSTSLPVFVNARQQVDIVAVFHLLSNVARQLDVPTAAYVLKRFVLRTAAPFLLRHGTAAAREAVAQVVRASFQVVAPSSSLEEGNGGSTAEEAAAGEAALVTFLTADLPTCMQVAPLLPSAAGALADTKVAATRASRSSRVSSCVATTNSGSGPVGGWAVQRQRSYWHLILHSTRGFTVSPQGTSDNDDAASLPWAVPAADGPLARYVCAAAMTCLGSSDVEVRTVGVGLVVQCYERWWRHTDTGDAAENGEGEEAEEAVASSRSITRKTLRALLSRVLVTLRAAEVEEGDGALGGGAGEPTTDGMATAWWNQKAADTWELRLMVLRLCTTLLKHPPHNADRTGCDSDVYRAADRAAAVCLSTFTPPSTPSPTTTATARRTSPLWQLQLALALTGRVVDAARTPRVTAEWRRCLLLLSTALPTPASSHSSNSSNIVIPNEGVAVHLLFAPLQLLCDVRAFMPLKPAPFRPSLPSATTAMAPPSYSAESLTSSTNRPLKDRVDSRTTLGGAGGRGSVQSTVTQRSTAPTVLGDTTASLHSAQDAATSLLLVTAHVQSLYAVVPLYQTWNARGVLEAMLPPEHKSSATSGGAATATTGDDGSNATPPLLQLQLVIAALAYPALHADSENDVEFWCSVTRRVWPLMAGREVSKEALARLSAHPPPAIRLLHSEELPVEVVAVLLVSLFLRSANGTTVAAAVAAAAEDWRVLCESALHWAEATVGASCGVHHS
jgi:hypothetical protein